MFLAKHFLIDYFNKSKNNRKNKYESVLVYHILIEIQYINQLPNRMMRYTQNLLYSRAISTVYICISNNNSMIKYLNLK